MPSNDTTVKFSADIQSFKTAMQQATRQIKLVNSEFKAATAGMEDWTKSEEGLNAKIKQLNGLLEQQKKKLAALNEELKRVSSEEGADSAAADRLRVSINNQQAAINKTEKELRQYNTQLEELPNATEEAAEASEKAAEGFTVFKAALADLVADGIKMGISALKDFAQEAIQVGMDFEKSMSNVSAISGASAEEMQQLTDKAKEMGESTRFSATEAADAFGYMSMAGWKTEEMLDGIEGVMNLAAASGEDLATTSDIVTDALTAMGYEAKDAGRLADVMAAASSNANTNVSMMGSTFQYVAPLVGALGMSMEDTAVAIGLMANAGIKGEKAGTALRSVLNRLSAPPKQCAEEMDKLGISLTDSQGNMKSLNELIIDLRNAFSGLSETEQTAAAKHIAGAEAMSGLLAIVNASDKDFQKLTVAINDSTGAAQEMADKMNDNVGGQLTLLQSKIQGIMIDLFSKASDSMKDGIKAVGEALDKVDWSKVGDDLGKFATKATSLFAYLIANSSTIISIVKAIGTAFATIFIAQKITSTVTAISTFVTALKGAQSASALLSAAMGALGISMSALPVMAIVAALGALAVAAQVGTQQMKENAQAAYGLNAADQNLINIINSTTDAIKSSNEAIKSEGENIDLSYQKLENMKDSYNALIDENGNVKKGYEELAQTLLTNLSEGLGTTVDKLKENIDLNGKLTSSIDELIEKKKQESKLAAFEDNYNEALKNEVKTWETLKDAKQGEQEALKALNEAEEKHTQAVENLNKVSMNGFEGAKRIREERQAAADLEEAKSKYEDLSKAVKDAQNDWASSQSTIENYEKATSAAMNNNATELNAALSKMQNGIVNYGTATKGQLEQQVVDITNSLSKAREEYKAGVVDESFVNNLEYSLEQAKGELDKFADNAGTAGQNASENLKGSAADGLSSLVETIDNIGETSYKTLDRSLGNWDELGKTKTDAIVEQIANGKADIATASEEAAQAGADAIKNKTSEFEAAADENIHDGYIGKIESLSGDVEQSGVNIPEWEAAGITSNQGPLEESGITTVDTFNQAVLSKQGESQDAGKEIGGSVAKGTDSAKGEMESSGTNFVDGFLNAIKNSMPTAFQIGLDLAKAAWNGLKSGQQEGSPSKLTYKSGEYFVEGYSNGIKATKKKAEQMAIQLAKDSIAALKKAQKEGSPSKLTYESGRMFTQGFIDGIASLEKQLESTTQSLVQSALSELLKLNNFDFSKVTENATTTFTAGMQKQVDYMMDRINYQNQQALKDFDSTMATLQSTSDSEVARLEAESLARQQQIQNKIDEESKKKQTKKRKKKIEQLKKDLEAEKQALENATKSLQESYQNQINEQNNLKESYQQAASSMITEFQKAVQEYQTAAQKLINDTMNEVSETYQKQYDNLISKQDTLISKLKAAGDLFNLSSANVMTVNDITQQTAQIKQYASKLETIKKKVSSELFDQITSYDMKEGEAFMDRLLAMSDKELKAYSDAYDEKMRVSEELSKKIYKSDFDNVASGYDQAMKDAFAGLPAQLEALGTQTMQGFLSGLNYNTDYMEQSVKTFVAGMVDEFKQQLGIHSPSKVAMGLGELFGEGFADGLLSALKQIKDAVDELTGALKDSFNLSDVVSDSKESIWSNTYSNNRRNRTAGSFGTDNSKSITFIQNNNSPKALDRLTIYRQTNNILFSAKVGLSNV